MNDYKVFLKLNIYIIMIINNRIQGIVKANTGKQQINDKTTKLLIVVEEQSDKYPSSIGIEFFNDRANLAEKISVGDEVSVWVNFRCKEYNGRHYTSITGWSFDILWVNNDNEEIDTDEDLPF